MSKPKQQSTEHLVRANWLRAAVLGASDGIVSTAGIVVGVASATPDKTVVLIAGVAGLLAGAISMAAGEYVSVSTQRDIEKEHHKKISADDDGEFTNPWHAAYASAIAFTLGAIIPLGAVMLPLGKLTIPATAIAVILALFITGYWSAVLAGTNRTRPVVRIILGGVVAMVATYAIGSLFNV